MEKFKELGLSPQTIQSLEKKGFEEPTEIQSLTIPLLLQNQTDIIAQAQTGTGKTAAFSLPLIEKLSPKAKGVQALILAPTRELVIQICEEINSLQGENNLTVAPIYGGQSIELQLRKLKRGVSIVVGTPGRIIDHINRGSLILENTKYFILDEADEMLNMGFIEDIEKILEHTADDKRVLLFSATMPPQIKKLAENYMGEYTHVKAETKLTTNLTDQIYFEVSRRDKFEALCRIIDIEPLFYGIIFCRTKLDVDELIVRLHERGYTADGLHGDISQAQREKILTKFRAQHSMILVATDVAARGIDINNLTHVINYSIPQNPEAYIHRVGRTGRAGNQGTAVTFVTPDEFRKLGFIKRVAQAEIKKQNVPEVKDILQVKQQKISDDLLEGINTEIPTKSEALYYQWAQELLTNGEPEQILASILHHTFGKSLDASSYEKITVHNRKERREKVQRSSIEQEGTTRLFIAKGKSSDMTKKSLVSFITGKSGIKQHIIDKVEVYENFSFITVPFTEAEIILKKFKSMRSGKKAIIEKAKEGKAVKPKRKRR